MSHSFIQTYIHAVVSTKGRRKIIPKEIQPQLWLYMAGICRSKGMTPIAINGMDDHAHVLFHWPPSISVARAVSLIKANSSKWMNEQGRSLSRPAGSGLRKKAQTPASRLKFAWQKGYGAFGVGLSDTAAVAKYIRDQEQLHRTMTFEQEFLILLEMNGVEFDPKEVFG